MVKVLQPWNPQAGPLRIAFADRRKPTESCLLSCRTLQQRETAPSRESDPMESVDPAETEQTLWLSHSRPVAAENASWQRESGRTRDAARTRRNAPDCHSAQRSGCDTSSLLWPPVLPHESVAASAAAAPVFPPGSRQCTDQSWKSPALPSPFFSSSLCHLLQLLAHENSQCCYARSIAATKRGEVVHFDVTHRNVTSATTQQGTAD